jgi:16S rRNA (cytidine1402-2'-O)-methyltransferase
LLSEAGLPCIADPGAIIVNAAHSKGIRIIPLIGPSSILSALISSGMCGQSFAFNGYLPIKSPAKENKIKQLEKISLDSGQTQIFIEAPYRNIQLLKTLISTCKPDTLISIACNLHCDDELIISKEVYLWSMAPLPDINKKPAVFCINGKNMYI